MIKNNIIRENEGSLANAGVVGTSNPCLISQIHIKLKVPRLAVSVITSASIMSLEGVYDVPKYPAAEAVDLFSELEALAWSEIDQQNQYQPQV